MFSSPKDLSEPREASRLLRRNTRASGSHPYSSPYPQTTFPQTPATLSILTTPHKVIRHTDSAIP
jgi:hypothetical protein